MSIMPFLRPLFRSWLFLLLLCAWLPSLPAQSPRDLGLELGVLPPGQLNAITDVAGVQVGHRTLLDTARGIRTGVTAILPHGDNLFQQKVPAAMYIGNGFGKLMGYSQVQELGNLETPIVLTNTLSVPAAAQGLIAYTLRQPGNEEVRSVNAVVGETNDGYLNDIRGMHVRPRHVAEAIEAAQGGPVAQGSVGAGTGTICFGFKGGIGTASRVVPEVLGGYTVGVLVQSNFGGVLQIGGVPVGEELGRYYLSDQLEDRGDGSCMMVLATDAPLDARNLERLAKRAILGLACTGGIATNGSGDYVIAFSTAESLRVPYGSFAPLKPAELLPNGRMSPLFLATVEATEEAIINSLFASAGFDAQGIEGLPVSRVRELMREYGRDK